MSMSCSAAASVGCPEEVFLTGHVVVLSPLLSINMYTKKTQQGMSWLALEWELFSS